MSRTQIVLSALLLSFVSSAFAAEHIDLNGHWQFRTDPAHEGSAQEWFRQLPANLETVDVPHTWNIGKYEDYEGTAWYFRSFLLPAGAQGTHVELHFGATFYRARVWVNGVEAGEHEGGHTAWFLDITTLVKPLNTVAVEIDNLPGIATIPGYAMDMGHVNVWYDWWHYGGIVRDVWLTVNQPLLLRRQHVRSKISSDSADVTDQVVLENFSKRAANATVRLTLYAPSGEPVAKTERALHASVGENTVQFAFHADHLKLWSLDQPEVYRVEATLADSAGTPIDSLEDNYGFRTIELRDGRLYLNGERVRLSGMTRHEESPWEGLAETRGTMLHDYAEMKELQVTLTRPVHYPQHPFILDFSDRNGILLIPEIPLWHFSEQQLTDPKVIALAKQMMAEMIEQNWNHPSIFGWSVCNESATNTPGGRRYFQTMYDWVKQLDPDRYVSYADDHLLFGPDPKINAASLADFVMMNEYAGTWHSDPENLEPALERIGREYPGKMVIISEFGAASLFAKDRIEGDALRRKIIARTSGPVPQVRLYWRCDSVVLPGLSLPSQSTAGRNRGPGGDGSGRRKPPALSFLRSLDERELARRCEADVPVPAASASACRIQSQNRATAGKLAALLSAAQLQGGLGGARPGAQRDRLRREGAARDRRRTADRYPFRCAKCDDIAAQFPAAPPHRLYRLGGHPRLVVRTFEWRHG